jgi:RHS repeat-associated protein
MLYGNSVSSDGTATNPFQWNGGSGYYSDSESGLQKVGARYYEAATGRWISQDSLLVAGSPADSQAVNRYLYCRSEPVSDSDPSGHGIWIRMTKTWASVSWKSEDLGPVDNGNFSLSEIIKSTLTLQHHITSVLVRADDGSLLTPVAPVVRVFTVSWTKTVLVPRPLLFRLRSAASSGALMGGCASHPVGTCFPSSLVKTEQQGTILMTDWDFQFIQ